MALPKKILDFLFFSFDDLFMFVRLVKKNNDHVSIRIVENVKVNGKVKQKTVCGVGHFHKDQVKKIEAHKRIGEEMIVKIKNDIRPALPGFESLVHTPAKRKNRKKDTGADIYSKYLKEERRIRIGVDDVFAGQYEQLGLFETIDTGYKRDESNSLLKDLVMERIDKPSSKRKSVINLKRDRGRDIDLDRVYRTMDKVFKREGWVQEKIAGETLSLFKNHIHVAFFDVTTLYFESFIPDKLRISGYSKDNKVKETQVVFALMTTTDGLPLGYELFPGNTYEGGTLISAVDSLGKKYDIVDISIIADRAMFTEKNLEHFDKREIKFIISAKMKKMRREMTDKILNDVESMLKNDVDKKISSWTGEYEYNGRRLVVGYSRKRAAKDRGDRERLLQRVKKKLKNGKIQVSDLVKNTGTKKYLKFDKNNKETAILDEEKIKTYQRWDGVYGIATNLDKERVHGEEIFKRYRGLWQVEDAFRVNKHDLKMRPVFHWTPKRIKAHILICYMAYALVAIVRHKLKRANIHLSIGRIREELGYIQASILRDQRSRKRFLVPSDHTDTQKSIYKALGLDLQEKVQYLK